MVGHSDRSRVVIPVETVVGAAVRRLQGKCPLAEIGYATRERYLANAVGSKRGATNTGDAAGDGDGGKLVVLKRPAANTIDAARDGDAGELVVGEHRVTNTRHAARDGDAGEVVDVERRVANTGDAAGDGDAGERFARKSTGVCGVADSCNRYSPNRTRNIYITRTRRIGGVIAFVVVVVGDSPCASVEGEAGVGRSCGVGVWRASKANEARKDSSNSC